MDFSIRSHLPEVMDEPGLDSATYQRCLADLAALNRLTMTHRPVLRWLAKATRRLAPGARFSLLDVAYGQGDLLRAIAAWAERRGLNAVLSGIDLNPRSAIAASADGLRTIQRSAGISRICIGIPWLITGFRC